MITSIHGRLEAILSDRVCIRINPGITLEAMVSSYTASRLEGQVGREVTLDTLSFLESQNQGALFLPRLAGFLNSQEKRFFELFVTTKGIGYRRGLRALSLPAAQIAQAIAEHDVKLLQTLPEIGRKMAENLVLELKEKVEKFLDSPVTGSGADVAADASDPSTTSTPAQEHRTAVREALDVLTQLGENRAEAALQLDQALRHLLAAEEAIDTQGLISRVYQSRRSAT